MTQLDEILKSKTKPKEKAALLVQKLKSDKRFIKDLVNFFGKLKDAEKGTCLAALTLITKDDPKFVGPYLDFVIDQINGKAPRVKWEASEIVANVAHEFPDEVTKAIPKLFENTKNEGTVVRWSAAYALTEMVKSNPKILSKLIPFFQDILKKEKQNGVRNVYVKAMKISDK